MWYKVLDNLLSVYSIKCFLFSIYSFWMTSHSQHFSFSHGKLWIGKVKWSEIFTKILKRPLEKINSTVYNWLFYVWFKYQFTQLEFNFLKLNFKVQDASGKHWKCYGTNGKSVKRPKEIVSYNSVFSKFKLLGI